MRPQRKGEAGTPRPGFRRRVRIGTGVTQDDGSVESLELRQMAAWSLLLMVGESEQPPLGRTTPYLGSGGFSLGIGLPASKVND